MNELLNIQDMIFEIRGQRVMIDRDLAYLYRVPTKALNQAVKRNMRRFPEDFMFRLSDEETIELVTNCDRLRNLKHSSSNPCAFTQCHTGVRRICDSHEMSCLHCDTLGR